MINCSDNPVEWSLLLMNLDEAKEHIEKLMNQMGHDSDICESDFQVQLFHIITHLNRIWNCRNHVGQTSQSDFDQFSKTPPDFNPIG